MIKLPSSIHPDLTDERIDFVGNILARVRAQNLMSSDVRDNEWSLGCRAYAWCCSEIIELEKKGVESWLTVKEYGLKFIFMIGKIEVSFYKGLPEKPKSNLLNRAQSYPEIQQLNLLPIDINSDRIVWSYAVETDIEGITTNIEFIGLTENGQVIASRRVPILKPMLEPISLDDTTSQTIKQNPAKVSLAGSNDDRKEHEQE